MKLLDDIIDSITVSKQPISDVLRQCLVLAYKLKNTSLQTWVEHELNGYPDRDDIPGYRRFTGVSKGFFVDEFGRQLHDQPLNEAILEPQHRHFASDLRLGQPIAAYEGMGNDAMIPWPQVLVSKYQTRFFESFVLNRAWMEIPASVTTGLVDIVRTRVLTFVLQIQSELPEDTSDDIKAIPPAVVDRIVNIAIYGGTNFVGDGNVGTQTIAAGDLPSLKAALEHIGITEGEFTELEASLQADATLAVEYGTPKGIGAKTAEWIGTTAKSAGKAGLKIGGAIAEESIKALVRKYLGLP